MWTQISREDTTWVAKTLPMRGLIGTASILRNKTRKKQQALTSHWVVHHVVHDVAVKLIIDVPQLVRMVQRSIQDLDKKVEPDTGLKQHKSSSQRGLHTQ